MKQRKYLLQETYHPIMSFFYLFKKKKLFHLGPLSITSWPILFNFFKILQI